MKRATTLVQNMLATANGLPLITVLILIGISYVSAKVISVPSSGRKLRQVLYSAQKGDTLVLESGTYLGSFILPPFVTIKAKEQHEAVINGINSKIAISLTSGNVVEGVVVKNSRIGIYSDGFDNTIKKCRVTGNLQSGVMAIGETPTLEDNIIYRNSGSGVQLYDVDRKIGKIDHNTIVYNDHHGVALGGKAEIALSNNIIAFNQKYTIKVSGDSVTVDQINNNYYYNIEINHVLPKGNYSYDPLFVNPEKNNFQLQDNSPALYAGEEGSCLGTRIYQNNNN